MMEVIVEQPLATPGSANKTKISRNVQETHEAKVAGFEGGTRNIRLKQCN